MRPCSAVAPPRFISAARNTTDVRFCIRRRGFKLFLALLHIHTTHVVNKGVSESRGQRRRGQWIPVQGHYQCTPLDGHRAHLRPEHRRRQVGLSQKRGGRRPRSSMNVGNVETVAVSTATELEIKRCSTINRRIKQDRLLRQEVHEWRFAFEAWVELLAEQRCQFMFNTNVRILSARSSR
ncbi:hypothetical protein MTP99_015104 [Tenebrio molitor]|jgi:hypothetical protein|nr:hypothetical protein MTP99_015104 [Tenebrio molitor]